MIFYLINTNSIVLLVLINCKSTCGNVQAMIKDSFGEMTTMRFGQGMDAATYQINATEL